MIMGFLFVAYSTPSGYGSNWLVKTTLVLFAMLGLALIAAFLATYARRMHDQDRDGRLAGLVAAALLIPPLLDDIAWVGALLGALAAILAFLPGTQGANRYGAGARLRPRNP